MLSFPQNEVLLTRPIMHRDGGWWGGGCSPNWDKWCTSIHIWIHTINIHWAKLLINWYMLWWRLCILKAWLNGCYLIRWNAQWMSMCHIWSSIHTLSNTINKWLGPLLSNRDDRLEKLCWYSSSGKVGHGYIFKRVIFLCSPSDLISHQVAQPDKCKMNRKLIATFNVNSLLTWL